MGYRTACLQLGDGLAHGLEGGGEVCAEDFLGFSGELLAMAGEVEDVDGGFAFGVD